MNLRVNCLCYYCHVGGFEGHELVLLKHSARLKPPVSTGFCFTHGKLPCYEYKICYSLMLGLTN